MGKRPQALVNSRLAAAVNHPTRVHAMTTLYEREASPRQIAAELGEPVNNVTYHVNQLVALGWIELVASRPARGGRVVEHFYRAIQSTYFDEVDWESLGTKERHLVDTTIINMISKDVSEAMAAGTFFEDDDNHLLRIPMEVDAEGWDEITETLEHARLKLMAIREISASRVADSCDTTRRVKINILQFHSPERRAEDD